MSERKERRREKHEFEREEGQEREMRRDKKNLKIKEIDFYLKECGIFKIRFQNIGI